MNNYNYMEWASQLPHSRTLRGTQTVGQGSVVSAHQQKSKMASQSGQNGEFIDLKELRVNSFATSVGKNSVKTVAQPSEDLTPAFHGQNLKAYRELIATATGLGALTPTQGLSNHLPAPTLGTAEKFSEAEKESSCFQQKQPSKTFIDGPPLPLFEDKAKEFGVDLRKDASKAFDFDYDLKPEFPQPATKYNQGEIKYTTKGALKDFIQDLSRLEHGTTGCIVDEICDPECESYTEGIHFLAEEHIGHGSYGKVDLCYDSKTKKPFVRKQLSKPTLRSSEVIVPMTLNHDNITKFYGIIQRESKEEGDPTMELLIEYAGCALNKYFSGGNSFTDAQIWDLSKQGLEALAHISHYSIVHLDIKPENICVTWTNSGSLLLKLTDFGSSRLPQEALKFVGLTPEYMAPEMCMIFLQAQRSGLDWGLTEADITGKVDMFAFALVIMYLYKHYHILVKVINNGKTTYEGLDVRTKRLLHMQLMTLMADDSSGNSFVQTLIPDECDLDMRALLGKMTEHKHEDRFSARQGLDFIEVKEQSRKLFLKQEKKVKDTVDEQYIKKHVPVIALDSSYEMEIPGIAEDCMACDNGPVKNRTKDALRMKLQPYGKTGKKGKNSKNLSSNKTVSAKASVSEMNELKHGIASKQMPLTPVSEFQGLSLGKSNAMMTERNAPVAQPSIDASGYSIRVSEHMVQAQGHPVQPVPGFIHANPYMSVQQENNVVSLGGKGTSSAVHVPQTGVGVKCLEIPQDLLQRFFEKKRKDEQAKAKLEPKVHPHVINIPNLIPAANREQVLKIGQTQHTCLFGDSPVLIEDDENGNLPKFSEFC